MTHLSAEQILTFNCLVVSEKRHLNKPHPHPPGENNRDGKTGAENQEKEYGISWCGLVSLLKRMCVWVIAAHPSVSDQSWQFYSHVSSPQIFSGKLCRTGMNSQLHGSKQQWYTDREQVRRQREFRRSWKKCLHPTLLLCKTVNLTKELLSRQLAKSPFSFQCWVIYTLPSQKQKIWRGEARVVNRTEKLHICISNKERSKMVLSSVWTTANKNCSSIYNNT